MKINMAKALKTKTLTDFKVCQGLTYGKIK